MSRIAADYIQLHVITEVHNEIFQLILKRSSSVKVYPNVWQVITGTIEIGETALQTALRELAEETGLEEIKMWSLPMLAQFYDRFKDSVQLSPTFLVFVENKNVELSKEHAEYKWLKLKECTNYLTLPSHIQGTEVIISYTENNNKECFFEKLKPFEIK